MVLLALRSWTSVCSSEPVVTIGPPNISAHFSLSSAHVAYNLNHIRYWTSFP